MGRQVTTDTLIISSTLATALLVLFSVQWYRSARSRRLIRYPPGPSGDFVLGNLRQMPFCYKWLTFAEWGQKYGPLTYLNVVGRPILVINTQEAAIDLLEKRASIYSDRPHIPMAALSGFAETTALLNNGPTHRKHRKLLAQVLHPRVAHRDVVPLQERIVRKLAQSLLDNPANYAVYIHRATGETVQIMTYGESSDGQVDLAELGREVVKNGAEVLAGHAVDCFPWLTYLPEWLPGTQFKRNAKLFKDVYDKTQWLPYDMVKRKASAGTAHSCFVLSALETQKTSSTSNADDNTISYAALTLYGAGSETVASTLCTFVLAMLLYPDVQAKARAEIDCVVGEDRLPTFASKDAMPYLNAVLLETLRWQPAKPIGIPHAAAKDDVYNSLIIPSGTMIIVNAWGILHDEHHFTDPLTFNPERFLNSNQQRKADHDGGEVRGHTKSIIDPWDVAFGYGRRMCPGISVARSGLWITMATILASFEIRPKKDPVTMKPILPQAKWTGGNLR
ncbi:hypothetical protein FRB94_001732 [Tulasnella sp. JGI-2019a]|nr:hypothetical protein FRB94_001732 [Tulasnella sp. JGI-2019a]KAG9035137.1 hypothetical protein FRB95_012004 [Tulasnella sp. JGI-2019a]